MIYLHIYIYKCAGSQPCIYSYAHNLYTTVARRFVNNQNIAAEATIEKSANSKTKNPPTVTYFNTIS
jgi:hypothetical protein